MTMIGRRQLLAALALVPLLPARSRRAGAAGPLDADLAQLGIAPEAILWSAELTLSAPSLADNAAAVPIAVTVHSTTAVRAIHLFAPANRRRRLATLTPLSDLAIPDWRVRVRLARSQTVIALATLADGRVLGARAEVQVTAGDGCRS